MSTVTLSILINVWTPRVSGVRSKYGLYSMSEFSGNMKNILVYSLDVREAMFELRFAYLDWDAFNLNLRVALNVSGISV